MTDKKYSLRYTMDFEMRPEGYDKEDVLNEIHGLCDAALFVSILKPSDGSYSQLILSADGESEKEMTQNDIFKVWLNLALLLSDNNALDGWRKECIDSVSNAVRSFFKRNNEVH